MLKKTILPVYTSIQQVHPNTSAAVFFSKVNHHKTIIVKSNCAIIPQCNLEITLLDTILMQLTLRNLSICSQKNQKFLFYPRYLCKCSAIAFANKGGTALPTC